MLFQVVFFGMVYFISKRRDVLYYSLLNLISGIYFFLNAPDTFLGIDEDIVFNSPAYLYANFVIFMSMIFMYLIFLKEIFNDTLEQYGYVKNTYIVTFYAIPILYLLFVLFSLLGWNSNIIFYGGHLVNGPFCTLILILNLRQQGYKKLIIYGMIIIFICVNITVALTIRYNSGSTATVFDKYPLAIIKIGMLIDILLFQLALLKRWNEQEKQLAVEKAESRLASEQLRNKISGELHDDLGGTLSGINMYSYMINDLLQNGKYELAMQSVNIIQKSADEMAHNLNDLVWTMSPDQDTLQKLIERLEEYAINMASVKNIRVQMNLPDLTDRVQMPVEIRRNIYLFCKEAINNAVKYSHASIIELNVAEANGTIEFSINDNGVGFNMLFVKRGNGLDNMQKRADEIGAILKVYSNKNEGTSVILQYKIT
jgi:signal transduction histidine kinase